MNSNQIFNMAQTICGETAYEMYWEWKKTGALYDRKFQKVLEKMRKDGIKDIAGAFGDYLWNDEGTLEDVLGDRIYEAGKNHDERIQIVKELSEKMNFPAWNKVMKKFLSQKW